MQVERQQDGTYKITVEYDSGFEGDTPIKWVFKEFTTGQFLKLDVNAVDFQKMTQIEQNATPIILMINGMMLEGPKIVDNTPYRITNYLKMELIDFLQ
jgi:hypothetical protein